MRQPEASRLLAGAATAGFAAVFGGLAVLRHRSFETGRFDLGNMVQAVWSTAQGRPLEATSLGGEQFTRLGAHFDPALALLAPLWLTWPSPELLLAVQAVALALGAPAVYLLARRHTSSEPAGALLAAAYLFSPVLAWMSLSDFHAVALATPALLWAFWFLDSDRLVPFVLCAVLAIATKEDVGLAVAAMGLWHSVSRRRLLPGAGIAVAAATAAVVAATVVVPHFSPTGSSSFYGRYDRVGGSPAGMVRTALTDPGRIVRAGAEPRDGVYVARLLAPLAGVSLAAPAAVLVAVPEVALNVLSDTRTQTSIRYQYSATALAGLFAAAVLGTARLARRTGIAPVRVAALVATASLAGAYLLGPLPAPGGDGLAVDSFRVSRHDRLAAEALRVIPDGAPVSASNSLGAHLSARRRILSFPRLRDAAWVAVDETSPGYLDRVAPRPYARAIARLRADPRWRLVVRRDGVLIFRRR